MIWGVLSTLEHYVRNDHEVGCFGGVLSTLEHYVRNDHEVGCFGGPIKRLNVVSTIELYVCKKRPWRQT